MEGTGTSATAMLVGTPEDVGGRPDAATVTLAREEIEEALASDLPLELILTVYRGGGMPQDVRVAWERTDLEQVLARTDDGGITFSFDRAELDRALDADFEGHAIREIVMLTVAAASASAALAASTASGSRESGVPTICQPLLALYPSAHQPSPMLRWRTPFMPAFMPLVPLASSGLRGVFSQTSHPWTSRRPTCRS